MSHLVENLGPDDDVGERAELSDPAASEEPGQHAEVQRPMGLAGTKRLEGARRVGQLREEVGQRGREGKGSVPLDCVLGQAGEVAVGGDDVDVPGVQGRDGNRTAPEDEVLGVFADLARREDVALADLVEGHGGLGEPRKLNHGDVRGIPICLKLGYDLLLVLQEEQREVLVEELGVIELLVAQERVGRCEPQAVLAPMMLAGDVGDEEGCRDLDRRRQHTGGRVEMERRYLVAGHGLVYVMHGCC